MKILVTGNLGYIGTVLSEFLINKGHEVIGYDAGFFEKTNLCECKQIHHQIYKDIRQVDKDDFEDIDTIVFLSALSNDPLGEFNPSITNNINFSASVKFIKMAFKCDVKKVVFVSSQSMYGVSPTDDELEEDSPHINPITEYAKAKYLAEQELKSLASDQFTITFLRPSTVFGASPRFRSDIVFNNFVACAYLLNKIEILSDGSPWRPILHIQDMCNAIFASINAPRELINGEAFNVGVPNGNYTVKQIAEAAQKAVPGSKLVFLSQHSDPRTYRVSFKKILTVLKDYYKPSWDLKKGAEEMIKFFDQVNFSNEDFRGTKTIRINQIKKLISSGKLSSDLVWK